jgi:hypothetical protein
MQRIHGLIGVLAITFAFVSACGDDDDDGDDNGATGGSAGSRGGNAGSVTGGRAGSSTTGGAAGASGRGGAGGRGGSAGNVGTGGDVIGGAGGQGGEGGEEAGSGGMGGMGGDDSSPCDPVAQPSVFVGELSGSQEVPMNASTATGSAIAELNALETALTVSAYWSGLSSNTVSGHVHGPAAPGVNADPVFDLTPPTGATSGEMVGSTFAVTPTQVTEFKAGLFYVNIHSANFAAGEIRAQLLPATELRSGTLSGDEEVPANASPGTGRAVAVLFPSGDRAAVSVTYSGLTGPATAGHMHGPAAPGENAGILFDLQPSAAASGSVTHKLWPLTSTLEADLLAGMTYANIHTAMYAAGEIRAQLLPACP